MTYSVGDVARLTGVTVRTLHHYDAIGLLRPSERTEAGYRGYTAGDLTRLARILCYRELGFGLEQIGELLDRSGIDALEHLRRQRDLLVEQAGRLGRMIAAIEHQMEVRAMGINLDPAEMFEVFGEHDPTQYEEEVKERWGDTGAYTESRRCTAGYTKDDWKRMQAEQSAAQQRLAAAKLAGLPPTSTEAMDAAEEARLLIDRWFYPCSHAMHRTLGEMYVADDRFAQNYNRLVPGMAAYVRDAIGANAGRNGA